MKSHPFLNRLLLPAALLLANARGEEGAATPAPAEAARIIGPITDGTPGPPAPPPELPDLVVKRTMTRQVEVAQPSEIPGWAPVTGTIKSTVKLVENPVLPALPPPLPPVGYDDPAVQARLADLRARYDGEDRTRIAFVSATWYVQEKVSLIRWWVDGEEMACTSRLNMLHFGGFGGFSVGGRDYMLVMGLGSEDTSRLVGHLDADGQPSAPHVITPIPEGQNFVVTEGDVNDAEKMQLGRDLHALGAAEGPRMEAAYLAREKAQKEREAYLRANPPKPKDVVIHYWRGKPSVTSNGEGGGQ